MSLQGPNAWSRLPVADRDFLLLHRPSTFGRPVFQFSVRKMVAEANKKACPIQQGQAFRILLSLQSL